MNRVLQQPVISIIATSSGMRDLAAILEELRCLGRVVVWFGGDLATGVQQISVVDIGVTITW